MTLLRLVLNTVALRRAKLRKSFLTALIGWLLVLALLLVPDILEDFENEHESGEEEDGQASPLWIWATRPQVAMAKRGG